jgi:hypothetical protein
MIGTAATDITQEVQSEVDAGETMRIEASSQGTRKTKKHGGTGDGRDRARWSLGMTEMKSDVEWIDPLGICIIPSISSFPVCCACFDPILIKIGLLSARWGLAMVVHSMVGTSAVRLWCSIGAHQIPFTANGYASILKGKRVN